MIEEGREAMAIEAALRKQVVVLYPSAGMGHLVSMVELGKLLIRHGLAVTVVVVNPPYDSQAIADFIVSAATANPSLEFQRLPHVDSSLDRKTHHHEAVAFDIIRLSNPHLHSFLRSISPRALIIDFFCTYSFEVTSELGIPCYIFFTSGANVLASFFHFPVLHSASDQSFRQLGHQLLKIPGLPQIPANHMPLPMLNRGNLAYDGFIEHSIRLVRSEGIIVNTFEALEPRALHAIREGRCVPEGLPTPRVCCIGPLIKSAGVEANKQETMEVCKRWLDVQESVSVVYLCFGSIGLLSKAQLQEIAEGLERSGHKFLWVVRSPTGEGTDDLLPSGFLDRTKERGLVLDSWTPQVQVLNHEAVGGFVTHCGWNSTLEALVAGVPMVGWPLYAEQRMNKVILTEELRVAAGVEGYDRDGELGLVTAEEVEAKIRWLMESEGGSELRARAAEFKERAKEALAEGGSSQTALSTLILELKQAN